MKLIYSQGFSKSERLDWKPVVFSNIVQSFRTIHEAMSELHYEFDSPDNEVSSTLALV